MNICVLTHTSCPCLWLSMQLFFIFQIMTETTNNGNGSNDSQGPTTDDGNATGLPHEQPLLHNREHGPTQNYPKTMATRCAHPVEDDHHVTICTDTPSVQFGPNHKIVTNATGNKPMTINWLTYLLYYFKWIAEQLFLILSIYRKRTLVKFTRFNIIMLFGGIVNVYIFHLVGFIELSGRKLLVDNRLAWYTFVKSNWLNINELYIYIYRLVGIQTFSQYLQGGHLANIQNFHLTYTCILLYFWVCVCSVNIMFSLLMLQI